MLLYFKETGMPQMKNKTNILNIVGQTIINLSIIFLCCKKNCIKKLSKSPSGFASFSQPYKHES